MNPGTPIPAVMLRRPRRVTGWFGAKGLSGMLPRGQVGIDIPIQLKPSFLDQTKDTDRCHELRQRGSLREQIRTGLVAESSHLSELATIDQGDADSRDLKFVNSLAQ